LRGGAHGLFGVLRGGAQAGVQHQLLDGSEVARRGVELHRHGVPQIIGPGILRGTSFLRGALERLIERGVRERPERLGGAELPEGNDGRRRHRDRPSVDAGALLTRPDENVRPWPRQVEVPPLEPRDDGVGPARGGQDVQPGLRLLVAGAGGELGQDGLDDRPGEAARPPEGHPQLGRLPGGIAALGAVERSVDGNQRPAAMVHRLGCRAVPLPREQLAGDVTGGEGRSRRVGVRSGQPVSEQHGHVGLWGAYWQ